MAAPARLVALPRPPTPLLMLVFSIPLLGGVIGRLAAHTWWPDLDALECAAIHAHQGAPLYGGVGCAGLHPAAFVYPPQVAHASGALVGALGADGFRALYIAVFWAALAALSYGLILRDRGGAGLRTRAVFLALITGTAVTVGNIGVLTQALVVLSLLCFPRTRLPFIVAVALAIAVKPVSATYLAVLLIERAAPRVRIGRLVLAGCAVALVLVAGLVTASGHDLAAWRQALQQTVLSEQPGRSFLGWAASLGLGQAGPGLWAVYLVMAAVVLAASVAVVELGGFSDEARLLFALGVSQLLNPRLMAYDEFVLVPAAALLTIAAERVSAGFASRLRGVLFGVCFLSMVLNCVGQMDAGTQIASLGLTVAVVAAGFGLAPRGAFWGRGDPASLRKSPPAGPALPAAGALQATHLPMLSLVICTLEEHEAIGGVLRELTETLAGRPHEILVVDDSRDDRTAQVVQAYGASHPQVRLLRRAGERGLASAAIFGWDAAEGDLLGVMDGDGQHDPRKLLEMLDRAGATAADIVIASRDMGGRETGLTGFRDRISRLGGWLTSLVLRTRVSDPMSGFFVMRRSWYEGVRPRLSGVGFKILVDVVASGARRPVTAEVWTALRPRAGGASKLDMRIMVELAALLLEKRSLGLISSRFSLFCLVGVSGLAVHIAGLGLARAAGAAFWLAQAIAIVLAMSSNFLLNNLLTFRDLRLHGRSLWRGLALFYLSCLGGAVLSEAAGVAAVRSGLHWILAGAIGALLGAVLNYGLAKRFAWRSNGGDAPEAAAEAGSPSRAATIGVEQEA